MNKDILGKILLIVGVAAIAIFVIIEAFQISISFGFYAIGLICFFIGIFFFD